MTRLRDDQLPGELWLGKAEGRWPVHAFTSESQVMSWLEGHDEGYTRRAWKVIGYELGPQLTVIRSAPFLAEVNEE